MPILLIFLSKYAAVNECKPLLISHALVLMCLQIILSLLEYAYDV